MIEKVISGGQVGADIAGLRAAASLSIPTGGWMPKGFKTVIGNMPEFAFTYGMQEMLSDSYRTRTRKNVRESDATIRFAFNFSSPGEICTASACSMYKKPCFDVRMSHDGDEQLPPAPWHLSWEMVPDHGELIKIFKHLDYKVLNIAGNASPQIELAVESYLKLFLKGLA